MNEFELIGRYFHRPALGADLGIGDDAALLSPTPGSQWAVAKDLLVSGRHFLPDADPVGLGHKALAVNLSDLAAMGARPRWALLGLAMPEADERWLEGFSAGFHALAERFQVGLVGGDTTRGPLTISVTVIGEVPAGQALRRDGAQPGDDVWVSGSPGLAAVGLDVLAGRLSLPASEAHACLERLHTPEPRVALGQALRGLAHAAIDISDGLAADLGHILERSALAARLDLGRLPSLVVSGVSRERAWTYALSGGDDYELCFTAPPSARGQIQALGLGLGLILSRLGELTPGQGMLLLDDAGNPLAGRFKGFDHFG